MKVAFVLDDSLDKPDGVQQYILTLGKWFSDNGHEVHYLVGQTKRTDLPNVYSLSRNLSVRFNRNRMSMPLPASKKAIKQLLEKQQYDVLHIQMPYSPFLAGRIIKAAPSKTAIVGTFHILPHGGIVHWATKLLGLYLRPTLKLFDKIVSVSQPAADFAKETFGVNSSVLPNVVSLANFTSAQPSPIDPKHFTIVYLGRLVPRKGCQILLEALTKLSPTNRELKTIICGAGPLEQNLKAFVAQNKLQNVEFTGFVSDIEKAEYLARADLAVFPSSGGESFGIVLIEAMAANRPLVLAGNNPGYRSVIGQEHEELLFPPLSPTVLAQKIDYYMTHEAERGTVVRWQLTHVKQFATDTVGPQLINLYSEALHNKGGVR